MKKLLAIGEALIDMILSSAGRITDVESFRPRVGGTPLDACRTYTALDGESAMTTMLGKDASGEKTVKEIQQFHIHTECIKQTSTTNTSLASVALDEHASREFSLYRNISASMLLSGKDMGESWFEDCYGLHFYSVSLGDFSMKRAHNRALELTGRKSLLISFDPSVCLPLFGGHEYLGRTIHECMHFVDILEISDKEVSFILGGDHIKEHIQYIFDSGVGLLAHTTRKDGAAAYTGCGATYVGDIEVKAVDTTGAGDGFIGCLLYRLSRDDICISDLDGLNEYQLKSYLDMRSKFRSASVARGSAITNYPSQQDSHQTVIKSIL